MDDINCAHGTNGIKELGNATWLDGQHGGGNNNEWG